MILALYGAGAMGREFRQIADESGKWSGVVFIDDHAPNVEAARRLGMKALVHRGDMSRLRRELRELGVDVEV